jgi:oxalate decarboxylase/phosphoglucose isomerase-like protein (cupin superfamily)
MIKYIINSGQNTLQTANSYIKNGTKERKAVDGEI